jgi:predicted nucleic acid-binding protein
MTTPPPRVLLDACVLANFGVCDLLLRLSERPSVLSPLWTKDILEEVQRTQLNKLNWPSKLAESFQREMQIAFPFSSITNYEKHISFLKNDPKDRHVLAAAIEGKIATIVTFNLKHFPEDFLAQWNVRAVHPQELLLSICNAHPERIKKTLSVIAARRKQGIEEVLRHLKKSIPQFADTAVNILQTHRPNSSFPKWRHQVIFGCQVQRLNHHRRQRWNIRSPYRRFQPARVKTLATPQNLQIPNVPAIHTYGTEIPVSQNHPLSLLSALCKSIACFRSDNVRLNYGMNLTFNAISVIHTIPPLDSQPK